MAIITLPRNNDKGWYFPAGKWHGIQPGDIIEFEDGDYSYINLDNSLLRLPHEEYIKNPVVFRPKKGVKTTIGEGSTNYSFLITNWRGFKVDGDNRLKIGGKEGNFNAQSFTFSGSDNMEVFGVELCNAQVGFHSNRKGEIDQRFENIYIHDCHVHHLGNPKEGGRAEAFYIGNTDKAFYQKGPHLHGVTITNNLIEDISGDGIQMAKCTGLLIVGNTIRRYGLSNLENQNTGIIVGGCSTGIVRENIIEDGKGSAIQIFGAGECLVEGNKIARTSENSINDAIYIEGKCSDGPPLKVRLRNNTIDKAGRKLVNDVKGSAIIEEVGNSWNPKPDPIPDPPKPKEIFRKGFFTINRKRFYYVMFKDGTWKETNSKYVPK